MLSDEARRLYAKAGASVDEGDLMVRIGPEIVAEALRTSDRYAFDYLAEEVLARVRALLRRSAGHATSELECGPIRLDTKSARVTIDGAAGGSFEVSCLARNLRTWPSKTVWLCAVFT